MTKGRAMLVLLALAGVLWALAARPWGAEGPGAGGPAGVADVSGDESSSHPVLTACAAVVAVATLLLAMLGRVGRIVVCVLLAAVGVGAILTATSSAAPASTLWMTAIAGTAVVVVSVWTAVVSPRWQVSGRYDRQTDGAQTPVDDDDPAAAWDALSRGEDPS